MTEIIDISVSIHPGMHVWGSGEAPRQEWPRRLERGDSKNVSALFLGSHTGTHVDAPLHSIEGGATLDQIPLDVFVGKALVIEVTDRVSIKVSDLEPYPIEHAERVLFKTRNCSLWSKHGFQEVFVYIEEAAAQYLVDKGVRLVGVDYLSVDKYGGKTSPSHDVLLGNGVAILETVDMSAVEPGEYTLICLPLKVQGADGAPARAILMR